MKTKRKLIKTCIIGAFILAHCLSFAVAKKRVKTKRRKTTRTHYVQPNVRPDLKRVTTIAKPLLFTTEKQSAQSLKKFGDKTKQVAAFEDPRESLFNDAVGLSSKIPQIDWEAVSSKVEVKSGKVYLNLDNLTLLLTIDPEIQAAAERFLKNNKHIVSGATAILEPQTGRVIALAQDEDKRSAGMSVSSRGPAASLIKIVTSAAAIEKEQLDPSYSISFRGGCGVLSHQNWIQNTRTDRINMSLYQAFGSSCNTFFARLALYHVGLSSLKTYSEKFMFNKPIPSDIKIQTSLFLLPDLETATPQEIAEAGAGFGATKLSPIHAALLSATVANDGIMMAPYLIEAAYDNSGRKIYQATPKQIGRVISKKTAEKLSTLMLATTATGTSRGVFHRSGTRANIDDIGGKTGTLLDLENRTLLYTWFSGVAFMSLPQNIAIGTVVASKQNYVVRANSIAQATIAAYAKVENID